MNQHPRIGVGVFVIKDNQLLFLKRKGSHGKGTWGLPGGHLEFGETLESCAQREVFEETSLKVKNIRFGSITNDIFEQEGKHYITIFMLCDYDEGEAKVMEPEKCENLEWFEWKNAPIPLFLPIQNLQKQEFNPLHHVGITIIE